jgi:hypothetical protein
MGSLLFVFFLAVALALVIVRLFRFPIQWTGYVSFGLLVAGVYLYSLLDARENPWTLWKRSWMQDAGDAEEHKLAKYATQDDCLKDQWKKLEEELERQKQVNQTIKLPRFHSVHLVEGRTVFQLPRRCTHACRICERVLLRILMKIRNLRLIRKNDWRMKCFCLR